MIEPTVRRFLKSSLAWLTAGVTLGVAMAVHPAWIVHRPAHLHMLVLGFVAMMIFGVAYHVIPRFIGVPLWSMRVATAHWWVANGGLLAMTVGFLLRGTGVSSGPPLLAVGGVLSALGAYSFAVNIWRTLEGRAPVVAAGRLARSLPLHEPTH
jgi:cbb3-type cytochrome oxidase subunit 1